MNTITYVFVKRNKKTITFCLKVGPYLDYQFLAQLSQAQGYCDHLPSVIRQIISPHF